MLKGSRLNDAEVPVTPISMCIHTPLTFSARSDTPIPTFYSGFPGLVALGGITHGREDIPVRQDWVPMISVTNEFFDLINSEMIDPLSKSPESIV